jgi:hypothetical protein
VNGADRSSRVNALVGKRCAELPDQAICAAGFRLEGFREQLSAGADSELVW